MAFFSDLLTELITFIAGNLPSNFFDNPYISTSLDYFQWLGWVIFAIASLFMLFSVGERRSAGEFVNLTTVFGNWVRALVLVIFARPLVYYLFVLCRDIAFAIVGTIIKQAAATKVPTTFSDNPIVNILTLITKGTQSAMAQGIVFFIMLIVSIVMTIQLLRIFGIFYVQVISGYLSVVDLMLGDGGVFYGWLRDVIANCVTFALQYLFYIGGTVIINASSFNGLDKCAAGLVLVVAAPAIPMALKRYGFQHGGPSVGGTLAGASRSLMSIGMIAAGG